jgi:predicted Zn-ribbon and HTH transcriptional regulator
MVLIIGGIVMEELKCKKCSHVWFSRRNEKPKVCPKCKSYKWGEEKKLNNSE